MREQGRSLRDPRPVELVPGFHRNAEGSALYRAGGTVVLATASLDSGVPGWMAGRGKGWLTAEYQMHPRANPQRREARDGRGKAPSGRTQEIQRLIGRALRAAIDLDSLGERTLAIDCDVLEADGGTRTASITAGFVAAMLALDRLRRAGALPAPVVRAQVAALSVGLVGGEIAVDLDYSEDSRAEVDLNLVATAAGDIVEVQGTAEGAPVPRRSIDAMIDAALVGVSQLCTIQHAALLVAGVELEALLMAPGHAAP